MDNPSLAIRDALAKLPKGVPKPRRVFLGETMYEMLHLDAQAAGFGAKPYPKFEDDRLEFSQMKVHCHRSKEIEFE